MAKVDLVTQLNRQYRENQGYSPAKREKLSAIKKLGRLEEFKDQGATLEMFADYSDTETGDLWHYDDSGILYVLQADEIRKLYPSYVPFGNSYLLGQTFKVKIKEVNKEEGKVYLFAESCQLTNADFMGMSKKYSKLSSHAERLSSMLFAGLEEGAQKVVVRATVTDVEVDRIFVDIFDTGIIGVIPVKNYAEQYRRDLRDCVCVGDSLKGVVFAYRTREGSGEPKRFLVSTAGFLTNPWKNARNFKKGDVIVVKCVEKVYSPAQNKQYFWGVSRMIPAIDIMCDFTQKIPESAVSEGRFYSCKITDIETRGRQARMKVSPFREVGSYDDMASRKDSIDNI